MKTFVIAILAVFFVSTQAGSDEIPDFTKYLKKEMDLLAKGFSESESARTDWELRRILFRVRPAVKFQLPLVKLEIVPEVEMLLASEKK